MPERPATVWIRLIAGLIGIGFMAWLMMGSGQQQPVARVEPDEGGLQFILENVPPGVEPDLYLFSDSDLRDFLRRPGPKDSRWLPNLALSKFPAVLLSYTWDLGYERVTGEHLFVHKEYRYPWRVEQKGGLTVYYAAGVVSWRVDRWAELNEWLPRFLESPQRSVVIYAMPDEESYARIIRGYGHLRQASAFWSSTREWIVLRPGHGEEVVAHELAHAYLAAGKGNPSWWDEGLATWVEIYSRARTSPGAAWLYWKGQLAPLADRMAREPVELSQVAYDSTAPADPYRVGLSLCIYLEKRLGTDGLKRLALATRERPLEDALREATGQTLTELAGEWHQAMAGGELLRWLEERAGLR